jgi:ATP-binding cassette subfamily F protein 3
MTCDAPHILLLDEPTNHLDVDSRQALIQALAEFEGAVVIATHDPHVIELTADRLWLIADGRVQPYDGDMDDYRSLMLSRGTDRNGAADAAGTPDRDQGGPDKKEQRRLAAEKRSALAPLKKRLNAAEAAVHRLEKEKAKLTEAMADPELYRGDSGRLIDLKMRLGRVEKDLATAEEAWIGAQDTFDRAQSEST